MAPTLVLFHGFTHTGASWGPVIGKLGERYRAVAPDIRGHASASTREPVTLQGVIEDLTVLAGGEDFTLAGYSMGGRIALHVALELGVRVQRLILIGASPGIADVHEREARRQADEQLADWIAGAASIEQVATRWESTGGLAGQPPKVAAFAHRERLRNTPEGLARALRGLGTGALPSVWERLGELEMPVVLVAGEEDEKFTATAWRMAKGIRDARVAIVPGVGHAAHLEAPEQVAELIAGIQRR
jgi:2-succinyl-6-hydroxy-2,4-cyclohexadiene-1-carboxylate synthase